MALASKLTGSLDAAFGMDMFEGDMGERFMEHGFLDDSESSGAFNTAEFGLHTSSSTDMLFGDSGSFSRQRGLSIDLSTLPGMVGGTRPRVFSLDFTMLPTDMVELESLEAASGFQLMEVDGVDPNASFDASAAVIANASGIIRGRGARSFSEDSSCLDFKMTPALQARCKTVVSKAPRSQVASNKKKKSKKGGSSSENSDIDESNDVEVARWTENPIYAKDPETKETTTIYLKFAGARSVTSSKPPTHLSLSAKLRKQEEKKTSKSSSSLSARSSTSNRTSVVSAVAKAAVGSLAKTTPTKSPLKGAISSPVFSKAKVNAVKSKAVKKAASALASASKKDNNFVATSLDFNNYPMNASNQNGSSQSSSSRAQVGQSASMYNKNTSGVGAKNSSAAVSRKNISYGSKNSSSKAGNLGVVGQRNGAVSGKATGKDQGDNHEYIGTLTLEQRKLRIARFLEKRRRRVWKKKVKYGCRKKLADSRPRVKGRFVPRAVQNQVMAEQKDNQASSTNNAMNYGNNSKVNSKPTSKAGIYKNTQSRAGSYGTVANGYKKPTAGYRTKTGMMVNNGKIQQNYVNSTNGSNVRKPGMNSYSYNKGTTSNAGYSNSMQQSRMMMQQNNNVMKPGMVKQNMNQRPMNMQYTTKQNGMMYSNAPGSKTMMKTGQHTMTSRVPMNNGVRTPNQQQRYSTTGQSLPPSHQQRQTITRPAMGNAQSAGQPRYNTGNKGITTMRTNPQSFTNQQKPKTVMTPTGTKVQMGGNSNMAGGISPQVNGKISSGMNRTGQYTTNNNMGSVQNSRGMYVKNSNMSQQKPGMMVTKAGMNTQVRQQQSGGQRPYNPAMSRPVNSSMQKGTSGRGGAVAPRPYGVASGQQQQAKTSYMNGSGVTNGVRKPIAVPVSNGVASAGQRAQQPVSKTISSSAPIRSTTSSTPNSVGNRAPVQRPMTNQGRIPQSNSAQSVNGGKVSQFPQKAGTPNGHRQIAVPVSKRPIAVPVSNRPIAVPVSKRPIAVPVSKRPIAVPASTISQPRNVASKPQGVASKPQGVATVQPQQGVSRPIGSTVSTKSVVLPAASSK